MDTAVVIAEQEDRPRGPLDASWTAEDRDGPEGDMAACEAPPTMGPEYYAWRRAQWLMPRDVNAGHATTSIPRTSDPRADESRMRLETVLSRPGAEEDEEVWREYLKCVYDGLVGGKRLKRGVKLHYAVRILKAGWLRDGTWENAAVGSFNAQSTSTTGPSAAVAVASSTTNGVANDHNATPISGRPSPTRRTASRLKSLITSTITPSSPPLTSPKSLTETSPTPTSVMPSLPDLATTPPPAQQRPFYRITRILPKLGRWAENITGRRFTMDDESLPFDDAAKGEVVKEVSPRNRSHTIF
ncbi:hypothetical protein FRB99_008706 [Tulasnella sp. 403]|nr:hypothetical protein FRB99_008706 [Tulasnella sp. 403]